MTSPRSRLVTSTSGPEVLVSGDKKVNFGPSTSITHGSRTKKGLNRCPEASNTTNLPSGILNPVTMFPKTVQFIVVIHN